MSDDDLFEDDCLKKELEDVLDQLAAERERANDTEEALTIAYMQGAADMRTERDAALANVAKLREVLVKVRGYLDGNTDNLTPSELWLRIDAALAETGGGDE